MHPPPIDVGFQRHRPIIPSQLLRSLQVLHLGFGDHTIGAAFHHDLRLPDGTVVFSKGSDPNSDSYSAFDGRDPRGILLGDVLAALKVQHLYVGGLATDYCVKTTVLDALKAGLKVTVLTDAIAGVDVVPGDSEKALEEMAKAGAKVCLTDEAVDSLRS